MSMLLRHRAAVRQLLARSSSFGKRNQKTALAVASAAILTAAAAFQSQEEENEESFADNNYSSPSPVSSFWNNNNTPSLFLPATATSCFLSLLSRPTDSTTTSSVRTTLRRHQTVELIETTAAEDTVDAKYRVDWNKPVGLGAFGAVYRAVDRRTGQSVAVKKIPKQCTNFATFQREMESLLHISKAGGHPNINALREHFVGKNSNSNNGYDDDDNYYLVLDLIEGGEMFDQLCAKGPYSEADAARLIRQVASALAFLHGVGLIHSDLKPENLMLTTKDSNNAVIQLVDFGCAHKVHGGPDDDHAHRGTASTPAYCPPEVLRVYRQRHAHIEPSFDMWSLGVILYVMLTGVHPFDEEGGSTDRQIEERVVAGHVPPLHHRHGVSDDARALVEGLMHMDPNQRTTANQLLEHPWVRGETASSRKIPQSDKRLRTYRRHQTSVGKHFFRTMLLQSSMAAAGGGGGGTDSDGARTNMCLLESAFRQLDQNKRGYVSTKELHGDTSFVGADAKLSFSEISDLLSEHMTNRYLPKGHVLYREGSKGDSMFFLNSGSVEVTSSEGFAKERGAGDFFGEDALSAGRDGTYSNTVTCKTAVHVIEISREYFEKYVHSDREVALTMAETDRLRNRERAKTILGLQKNMTHKEYHKGDVIFRQGSQGDILYIVEEGNVDIFRDGHKVRSLQQGEMTGEHAAYYAGKPYNVTARCVGDKCKMGVLKSKDMHKLFQKNPSLQTSFHDIILRRDFKKAICAATKHAFPQTEEELRAAFVALDTNKSGVLELDQLRRVMLEFDPSYTEENIRTLLDSMDLNKSGSLTWTEFKLVFGMAKEA